MRGYKGRFKRLAAVILAMALLVTCAAPALAEAFSAIVTTEAMAVYADAAMTERLFFIGRDEVTRVLGYSDTIAKISFNGQTGFAKVADMKRVDAVAQKAILNAAAEIYESPDEDADSVEAPEGTKLYVLSQTGEWSRVERGGVIGYVQTSNLTTVEGWAAPNATGDAVSSAQTGVTIRTYSAVTTESVKVYKSARDDAKVVGTLDAGTKLIVLATSSGGWAYIEEDSKHGFCRLSGLREIVDGEATPTPAPTPAAEGKPGVVSADALPVYEKADTESRLLGTLKKGKSVNVIDWNSEWARIELNGNYGYCAVKGLAKPDATPQPTPTPSLVDAKTGTVTVSSLPVYQTASASGVKLGTLKKGKTVNVIRTSDGWAYIELDGNYGFCSAKGLKIEEKPGIPAGYKKADVTATVVISDTRAYASPSTDAENVALALGAEVRVRGYNKTWACIEQGGNYAFVALKALSKAKYDTIDGDGEDLQTLTKLLLTAGYFDGVPGESYNAAAIAAIKRFQAACGLSQTGVADQAMLRIVYSGYAPVCSLLYATLSSGDRNDNVSRLQARLYTLGYLSKSASLDGGYGTVTVAAVKLFQNASGIEATGTADPATLKALYAIGAKKLPSGSKAADATTGGGGGSGSTYLDSVPVGLASTTTSYSGGMTSAEKLEYAIYLAQSKLGRPYVYGATGPEKFDCSGLTTWIFQAVGVSLKRSAYAQGYDESYPKIEGAANLRRGDIVFFNTVSDSDLSDHAGVYIGEGYFIHASSGAHRVVVSNLLTGYYARVYSWGRRVLK